MRYVATWWPGWPQETEGCLLTLYVCKGTERAPRAVASLAHIVAFCRFVDLGNKTKDGRLFIWVPVRRAQLVAQNTPAIRLRGLIQLQNGYAESPRVHGRPGSQD